MDQNIVEAMRMKAIFYSDEFIGRFGDWISASMEFDSLAEQDQTKERKNGILNKYNVIIDVNEQFEPIPTKEVMEFVYAEYFRIYSSNN